MRGLKRGHATQKVVVEARSCRPPPFNLVAVRAPGRRTVSHLRACVGCELATSPCFLRQDGARLNRVFHRSGLTLAGSGRRLTLQPSLGMPIKPNFCLVSTAQACTPCTLPWTASCGQATGAFSSFQLATLPFHSLQDRISGLCAFLFGRKSKSSRLRRPSTAAQEGVMQA